MSRHPGLDAVESILRNARNPELRGLLEYWVAIHPGDRLPSRRDFDPLKVRKALPNLVLTDVERDPYRFRIRLMGTAVVAAMQRDFTGRYLDEVWPDAQNQLLVRHRVEVAETGLPNYRYGLSPTPFRLGFAPLERVFLPLAEDGERVDMILSMVAYMERSGGSDAPAIG
ncbi:hypothetical protein GCM10017083_44970 [Thalassobaculum fulvum]|uniref:PAS domain-containing protein n=1 Tax=Thalassobaculum fulvum TaxID=1633335 RepID=A0A918XVT7_9PROT|nr:PAS domain-containing protein [Thalassobaculum fulvum]GHD59845.1 hypothetical protein GCM10017083_44970 [Thalassobaculum fulvum]